MKRYIKYPSILALEHKERDHNTDDYLTEWTQEVEQEYVLYVTKNNYYKITYQPEVSSNKKMYLGINLCLIVIFVGVISLLLYIRHAIIKPFGRLRELPYELSKGNLVIPIEESKYHFFGRYLWGMDLLREKLEENKERELRLQKDKKLLLLSLSHDIKTPLSAIKLYAKALSKNLYKEEEKKIEVAESISKNVDVIETYISEIVQASKEDFLQFDVTNAEIYIGDVFTNIIEYYEEKMELNNIEFSIQPYQNCLVMGDLNRLIQVMQNIIENAIKYGDGRKIWIEIKRGVDEYGIMIKNTGCELEQRELPHIFDSFYRGSNVAKRAGSGLGLYISRSLIHLMGGEVIATIEETDECRVMAIILTLQMA